VLVKSAFECLLCIWSNAKEFARALQDCMPDMDSNPQGPLLDKWKRRFPHAPGILGAWAQEFCALRGAMRMESTGSWITLFWECRAHLAFASILFPLIVKRKLTDASLWEQREVDAERLRRIREFANNQYTILWT
jgi:hypothetical protein